MCLSKVCPGNVCDERVPLGRILASVLDTARQDNRLIYGLVPSIACLEKAPEDSVLCLLAETQPGDATAHLQTVLLQAFCYENYIPVITVDNSDKLAEFCGSAIKTKGCQCAVITRDLSLPWSDSNYDNPPLTANEQTLADFYECTIDASPSPIVKLPR